MTTATKSLTVLELLSTKVQEGQQAKVTTDNDLYGMTVVKREGNLLNVRTGENLLLTNELLKTKFRLVNNEVQVPIGTFLKAYTEGKKLKVEIGDRYRMIQKKESDIPQLLREALDEITPPNFHINAMRSDNVMTLEELTIGKFYIVE